LRLLSGLLAGWQLFGTGVVRALTATRTGICVWMDKGYLVTISINALSSMRALMSGVLWNGLGRVLPIAVAMVATPFLLHRLGVDRWALFTLALSLSLAISRGVAGHIDQGVECSRGDFCEVESMPRRLQIALGP
jgi:hypothetical protein